MSLGCKAAAALGLALTTAFVSPVSAATVRYQQSMEDLLQIDQLGYNCIPEELLDQAFLAGGKGKGARMPRTCLPNPCDRALERPELGELIGRPPTDAEWHEYYSRYAHLCRHEAVWDEPEGGIAGEVSPEKFWPAIFPELGQSRVIPASVPSGSISTPPRVITPPNVFVPTPPSTPSTPVGNPPPGTPPGTPPTNPPGTPPTTPPGTPPTNPPTTPPTTPPTNPPPTEPPVEPPAVIPIPSTAGLLFGALGLLAVASRRRKRSDI